MFGNLFHVMKNCLYVGMVASIDRKLKWNNKVEIEDDDEVKLLVSAWDSLLLNDEDFLKKLGMNKSDVPNAPHLENCEEKARVRERLDTRIANRTFPSWVCFLFLFFVIKQLIW